MSHDGYDFFIFDIIFTIFFIYFYFTRSSYRGLSYLPQRGFSLIWFESFVRFAITGFQRSLLWLFVNTHIKYEMYTSSRSEKFKIYAKILYFLFFTKSYVMATHEARRFSWVATTYVFKKKYNNFDISIIKGCISHGISLCNMGNCDDYRFSTFRQMHTVKINTRISNRKQVLWKSAPQPHHPHKHITPLFWIYGVS